ncbi:hypothetical protein [Aliiroseovarius sp.]|uniref:hypothetical protein n=1 Tax=Aliiroseovarius sp. TaxID=1872442 RepID=UPI00263628B4|nr:hypothetical protein [Aliiroseovarius sp.]
MHDPRYHILFAPMQIAPVPARNRFGQVARCVEGGYLARGIDRLPGVNLIRETLN